MKKYEYAILSIILLSAFFINSFYNTNSFPIHPDEYTHIAQGVDIIEKGKIDFVNPYFSYPLFHPRLESGFHLLLAILIIIFKDNFIFWFNFLKNLIFVLNTFLIFFLAYRISKNFLIGIFSATFFLFLKSDLAIYGNLFLVPLTLSIALIMLFFIFFFSEKKNSLYYSIILFIMTLITYPPASVLIFLLILLNFIINFKELKSNKKYIYILSSSVALLLIAFIIFLIKIPNENPLLVIINNFIIFKQQWTPIKSKYSPISFYGTTAFLLAFLGFITLLFKSFKNTHKESNSNEKSSKENFILILFIFGLIETYFYYIFKFTLFLPFPRIFFYYLISLCFLSAFGIQSILDNSKSFIKNKNIFYITLTIILCIIFINQFFIFHENAKSQKFQNILDESKYQSLNFIKDNYGKKNTIIADDFISFAVFPLTRNYVVSILDSNLAAGMRSKQIEFFQGNCEKKKEISNELNISLILTEKNINCSSTKLVYNKKINVYETK